MQLDRVQQERLGASLQIQWELMDRAGLPIDSPLRLAWAMTVREIHLLDGFRSNSIADRFAKELSNYFRAQIGALGKTYLTEKTREEITSGKH